MSATPTWWKSRGVRRVRRRMSEALEVCLYPVARFASRVWMYTVRHWVRWTESGPLLEFMERGEPVVMCCWHQDILPSMAYAVTLGAHDHGYPMTLMVGDGRAGSLGGTCVVANGVHVIVPEKHTEGGRVEAVRQLAAHCTAERRSAIITGDGSRGPAFEAKWGAVHLARDTGFPIVPVRTRFRRGLQLQSTWARFLLPAIPGWGRAHISSGAPLHVPVDADKATLEECRQELERRLNALIPHTDARLRDGVPGAHGGAHYGS